MYLKSVLVSDFFNLYFDFLVIKNKSIKNYKRKHLIHEFLKYTTEFFHFRLSAAHNSTYLLKLTKREQPDC